MWFVIPLQATSSPAPTSTCLQRALRVAPAQNPTTSTSADESVDTRSAAELQALSSKGQNMFNRLVAGKLLILNPFSFLNLTPSSPSLSIVAPTA